MQRNACNGLAPARVGNPKGGLPRKQSISHRPLPSCCCWLLCKLLMHAINAGSTFCGAQHSDFDRAVRKSFAGQFSAAALTYFRLCRGSLFAFFFSSFFCAFKDCWITAFTGRSLQLLHEHVDGVAVRQDAAKASVLSAHELGAFLDILALVPERQLEVDGRRLDLPRSAAPYWSPTMPPASYEGGGPRLFERGDTNALGRRRCGRRFRVPRTRRETTSSTGAPGPERANPLRRGSPGLDSGPIEWPFPAVRVARSAPTPLFGTNLALENRD